MAGATLVCAGCPALASGPTPFSAATLPRRRVWHPTIQAWCTAAGRACVLAVLVAELPVDRQEDPRLPSLPHELWLLIWNLQRAASWGCRCCPRCDCPFCLPGRRPHRTRPPHALPTGRILRHVQSFSSFSPSRTNHKGGRRLRTRRRGLPALHTPLQNTPEHTGAFSACAAPHRSSPPPSPPPAHTIITPPPQTTKVAPIVDPRTT